VDLRGIDWNLLVQEIKEYEKVRLMINAADEV